MNVAKSGSWAVCQEFLGKLEGDELRYVKTRAGSWSRYYKYSGFADDYKITSMRDVLTRTCRIQNVNTVFFGLLF